MPKRGAKREYIVVAVRGDAANGWNICDTFGNPSVCRVYNNHEHAAETAAAVAKALNGLVSGH